MRAFFLVFVLGALSACTKLDAPSAEVSTAAPSSTPEAAGKGGFVSVKLDPSVGDVKSALAAEVKKAKDKGLKPYVELWATWCPPCVAIEKNLEHPKMKAAFAGVYLVRLDIDAWGSKLDGMGLSSAAIPVFYALDDEGKPTARKVDGGAWGDDVPENMGPVLDKFFHGT